MLVYQRVLTMISSEVVIIYPDQSGASPQSPWTSSWLLLGKAQGGGVFRTADSWYDITNNGKQLVISSNNGSLQSLYLLYHLITMVVYNLYIKIFMISYHCGEFELLIVIRCYKPLQLDGQFTCYIAKTRKNNNSGQL